MEVINYVDPPNKPMDTKYKPIQGPKLHKDLIFVDVDESGRILIGSTNVTGSFWEGSVQIFKNFQFYEQNNRMCYYNSSIIYDGKLISNSNSILISDSPMYLKLLSVPDDAQDVVPLWRVCIENAEKIKFIELSNDESRAFTCGAKYVTIWDIKDNTGLKKICDYTDNHTDDITSIAVKKSDSNIFATTGLDRRACIWDSRMESPAMELYLNEFCALKSASWNHINSNILAVGSEAGDLYLLDITQPKDFTSFKHCFKSPIHKIKFNDSGYLAVCGNTSELQIYNCNNNEFELVESNNKHTKFVRGLAWSKNCLYSCGFDTKIHKHSL